VSAYPARADFMHGEISLRPESPEDAAFLFRLYASTRADEMKLVPWSEAQKTAFLRMQFEAQTKHYHAYYPDASFEIILFEGRPIGRQYLYSGENEILLIDIALLPEHRGRGIGGRLLDSVLTKATTENKPVRIHVERENAAMRLYIRRGFRLIEDKGIYHLMAWTPTKTADAAESNE
jgi:ribosomal protein S18 acetylase RimI-like enzyme